MTYIHTPVLLNEMLQYLSPEPGEVFIDATLGGGGYTRAIAERVGDGGMVLAIDTDEEAINNFQFPISNFQHQDKVVAVHGNFRDIERIANENGIYQVNGIVADLGLSSFGLDASGRGFSFQKSEPLDMRFDVFEGVTAREVLQNYSQESLTKIFSEYGEEKLAARIAKKIVMERGVYAIQTTNQLLEIIEQAIPKPLKHKANDVYRKIFQAIRIEVNQELAALREFLPKAFDLLLPGGRLVVVSFHSLEDREVKLFFNSLKQTCVCPPRFPVCVCNRVARAEILTKKPVIPSLNEKNQNSRSKSAKLRAIKKL